MNRRTEARYQELRTVGLETHTAIQQLNTQYAELEPYLRSVVHRDGAASEVGLSSDSLLVLERDALVRIYPARVACIKCMVCITL